MLAGLSDGGLGGGVAGRVRPSREADTSGLRLSMPGMNPVTWMGGLWSTSACLAANIARATRGTAEFAVGLMRSSEPSSLNGPITGLRRYSAARVSLSDVKEVCQAFDVTVNDVALAALTESYRALLTRRGEQPLPDSLRTLVPVSMRSATDSGTTER